MQTVIVKKTNNPEKGYETKEQLLEDTKQHITDVGKVLSSLSYELVDRGDYHDWSKIEYFDQFAQDTLERKDTPDFKSRAWYNVHTKEERHHINARVPDDVNFIDILEMIVDCCVAGKTRTGSVNDEFLIIPQSVLNDAYWNTVELIKNNIQVYQETIKKE